MKVDVVGAGLAGLTFALAAERHGLEVELRDERPSLGGGAALTLWPRALSQLEGLGLADVLHELGEPAPTASVRRPDGHVVQNPRAAAVERAVRGVPRVFDRGDLQLALAEQVRGPIRLGAPLGPDDDTGAVVVGADGFRSVVARRLDPRLSERPTGHVAFRGVVHGIADPREHGVVWGPGMEAGIAPMRRGRTYWFATLPEVGASVERLLEAVDGWAPPLASMIRETPADQVSCVPVSHRSSPWRWHDDRHVVIGDAAHAMLPALGLGGGHAIVDAAVLAGLLAGEADPQQAFVGFEAIRRREVTRVARSAARAWDVSHGHGLVGRAGRLAADLAPSFVAVRAVKGLAG